MIIQLDVDSNGKLKRNEMIEEILPWDIANRLNIYQQDVFVPIRCICSETNKK